jgi:hypothetical protein
MTCKRPDFVWKLWGNPDCKRISSIIPFYKLQLWWYTRRFRHTHWLILATSKPAMLGQIPGVTWHLPSPKPDQSIFKHHMISWINCVHCILSSLYSHSQYTYISTYLSACLWLCLCLCLYLSVCLCMYVYMSTLHMQFNQACTWQETTPWGPTVCFSACRGVPNIVVSIEFCNVVKEACTNE